MAGTRGTIAYMDVKVWLDFTLGILQMIVWPAIIVVCLIAFRLQIRNLLDNVESAKVAGVEAKFFSRALEDPANSNETKDTVAQIWVDVATALGKPIPEPASEQLSSSKRNRGQLVSPKIAATVAKMEYADQVRAALARISEGKFSLWPSGNNIYIGPGIDYKTPSFELTPSHGASKLVGFALTQESEVKAWSQVENFGRLPGSRADSAPDVLVISPFKFEAPNFRTVCWHSEDDDNRLADALEDAGMFDFVKPHEG